MSILQLNVLNRSLWLLPQVTLQVSGACGRGRSSETRMRPAPLVEPEVERAPGSGVRGGGWAVSSPARPTLGVGERARPPAGGGTGLFLSCGPWAPPGPEMERKRRFRARGERGRGLPGLGAEVREGDGRAGAEGRARA